MSRFRVVGLPESGHHGGMALHDRGLLALRTAAALEARARCRSAALGPARTSHPRPERPANCICLRARPRFPDGTSRVARLLRLTISGSGAEEGQAAPGGRAPGGVPGQRRLREILEQADAVDAAEDEQFGEARGDELPPELCTAQGRRAWLREAKRRLDDRRAEEARPIPRSRPEAICSKSRVVCCDALACTFVPSTAIVPTFTNPASAQSASTSPNSSASAVSWRWRKRPIGAATTTFAQITTEEILRHPEIVLTPRTDLCATASSRSASQPLSLSLLG